MNFLKIKETCLYVNDLELARQFYGNKLKLPEISYLPGKHVFYRAGESVLLIFNPDDSRNKKSPPPHFANGNQHFAFEVNIREYDAAKKEIELMGIPIIEKVIWNSGKESFYFNDPENNVLEIVPSAGIWD